MFNQDTREESEESSATTSLEATTFKRSSYPQQQQQQKIISSSNQTNSSPLMSSMSYLQPPFNNIFQYGLPPSEEDQEELFNDSITFSFGNHIFSFLQISQDLQTLEYLINVPVNYE